MLFCQIVLKVGSQSFTIKARGCLAEEMADLGQGDTAEVMGHLVNEKWETKQATMTRTIIDAVDIQCVTKKPRIRK